MPQLDSLRAISLIFVVLTHWIPARRLPSGDWVTDVDLLGAGNHALQLFFIMSGFLITSILLSAREKAEVIGQSKAPVLRRFYARRFLRIFPVYYLTLIVLYFLGEPSVAEPIAWHLTYTTNFFYTAYGDWYGRASPLWSLSVEEQFYFVWPLVILFAPRRFLLPFFVFCILLAAGFRFFAEVYLNFNMVQIAVNPLRSLDTLGLGALFALLQREEIAKNRSTDGTRRLAMILGAVAVFVISVVLFFGNLGSEFLRVTVLGAAYPFALLTLMYLAANGFKGWLGRLWELGPLLYIGKISYALYIFHCFVPMLTSYVFSRFGINARPFLGIWGFISLNFMVLFLLGSISWFLYENPINKLKRFFPYVGPRPVGDRSDGNASALSSGGVGGSRSGNVEDLFEVANKAVHSDGAAENPEVLADALQDQRRG